MALILESNYNKLHESVDKANDLIRVYFGKRKSIKTKEMHIALRKIKTEIAYIRNSNYETKFIEEYMSELITALTNFIYAKDDYVNQNF